MELDKQEALTVLRNRGYDTEWAEDLPETIRDSDNSMEYSYEVLDFREVEGQIYDGMFEGDSQVDLAELTDSDPLVGRMMFYMISIYGDQYTYENLVEDLEELAERYNTAFDKSKAKNNRP